MHSIRAGTYSIVAVDKRAGEMGAAIKSRSFAIGSRSLWAEPGVGVVVAQGTVEQSYGPLGLALMRGGKSPPQTLKSLLATDLRPNVRQVAMIDARGRVAAHTGKNCIPESGHVTGRGFASQANFVSSKRVWRAAGSAFRRLKGSLAERMLWALEAGKNADRDAEGVRSAAVIVISTRPSGMPWEGRVLDLRIESSDNPLKELRRLLQVQEAYSHAAVGDESFGKGDPERGKREYSKAVAMARENSELRFWQGIQLLNHGDEKKGVAILKKVLHQRDKKAMIRELESLGLVELPGEGKKSA